jgi:MYXO-CTERM domain-containing protein
MIALARTHVLGVGIAAAALVATVAMPTTAFAGLAACGDIHVEANAQCEVLVEGGCEAQCEPVRLEAACSAELYANCEGQCTAEASLECRGSCEGNCVADCDVQPAQFDCRASCNADCQGECSASCSSNDSECRAACEGTCSASCDGRCEATPPSASCEAKCEASCEGSCEGAANVDCQVDCQAGGFAMCEADLQGGCEAQCRQPEGALFCDGQYIDHGGNLDACVAALKAQFDIEVEGYANGQCANGSCEGEAGGSVSCSVGSPAERSGWAAFGLAAMFGLVTWRRRS